MTNDTQQQTDDLTPTTDRERAIARAAYVEARMGDLPKWVDMDHVARLREGFENEARQRYPDPPPPEPELAWVPSVVPQTECAIRKGRLVRRATNAVPAPPWHHADEDGVVTDILAAERARLAKAGTLVTDEMVDKACRRWFPEGIWVGFSDETRDNSRRTMRAALEAVLPPFALGGGRADARADVG